MVTAKRKSKVFFLLFFDVKTYLYYLLGHQLEDLILAAILTLQMAIIEKHFTSYLNEETGLLCICCLKYDQRHHDENYEKSLFDFKLK